jgi:hypothetical protein
MLSDERIAYGSSLNIRRLRLVKHFDDAAELLDRLWCAWVETGDPVTQAKVAEGADLISDFLAAAGHWIRATAGLFAHDHVAGGGANQGLGIATDRLACLI